MHSVVFLVLRRMRAPLVLLILSYAIAVLGFVLIPGVDADGRPWRMSFFHAFYIVSYTATTIGFGEIPYALTDAQRLWMIASIYLTVVAWFYGLGKILQLMQDAAFQQVVERARFTRGVRRLREPFYVVVGFGETGSLLVRALDRREFRCVVVDIKPDRAVEADLLVDYASDVLALCADARQPETLLAAGIANRWCAGVIALTDDEQANLSVAVTVKLLRPGLAVVCRAESREVAVNMASFGTDHVIDPFQLFGAQLGSAIHAPGVFLLQRWLTAVPGSLLPEPLYPPGGNWVVCGHGRFGQEVVRNLEREGSRAGVVEVDPRRLAGVARAVHGRGTEASTLIEAGIREAVGIVAGTSSDVTNLSVVMTAREIRPDLFVVLRKNYSHNDVLFDALRAELVMQPAQVVAQACLHLLVSPLVSRFLSAAGERGNDWCNELASRLAGVSSERAPLNWTVEIERSRAPAACSACDAGGLTVGDLLRDPQDRDAPLSALALLLVRDGEQTLLPQAGAALRPGDRLLMCGRGSALHKQRLLLHNHNVLRYAMTGEDSPGGWLWRRLAKPRAVQAG
jgi:Trk K+ transport system NAD-binding subunit